MPYTAEEIKLINKTTAKFYSEVAESFSETRQHEWEGWRRSLPYVKEAKTLLDLGCGNRRYSKFLQSTDPNCHLSNRGLWQSPRGNCHIDNVDNFAWDESVRQVDIIESLLDGNLNLKSYDVAVCFGVMHHIPTAELREKLLCELTKSKVVIVSFWQFEKDERIFTKAQNTTKIAQEKLGLKNLEDNDYFLGWKDREDVFRFCHNFTKSEVESITSKFNVIDSYTADKLNKYLVLGN